MAWASKKQYAILMNNENGKDLILKLPDMTQEAFSKAFGEFLKGNNIPYEEENEEDEKEKIDLFNDGKTRISKGGDKIVNNENHSFRYLDIEKAKANKKEVTDFLSKPFDYKVATDISNLIGKGDYRSIQNEILRLYGTYNPDFMWWNSGYATTDEGIIPKEQTKEYIKEQEEREKREQEAKKEQEERKANIEKYAKAEPSEIMKELDDDKLYENKSKYESSGGYQGSSKSNRAVQAEKDNQFPLSKWGKNKIKELYDDARISFSSNFGINDYIMSEIEKLSDKEIKDNLLEYSSWHHSSKFANPVNYYGLVSPKEIYQYILDKKEKEFNYLDKETMEKLKSTDKGKDLILKAPTMDKKELRKAIKDYLKE